MNYQIFKKHIREECLNSNMICNDCELNLGNFSDMRQKHTESQCVEHLKTQKIANKREILRLKREIRENADDYSENDDLDGANFRDERRIYNRRSRSRSYDSRDDLF